MGIIVHQLEVFEFEVVDVFDGRIEMHLRKLARFARELDLCLLNMICVEMEVTKGVDECAGP